MRPRPLPALCLLVLSVGLAARGQEPASPAATTLTGILREGLPGETPFTVLRPAAWNGTLVLDLDFLTGWRPAQRQWFLDRGYAIGGTRRTQNESAYDFDANVENFLDIRRRFAAGHREPARTIAHGVSRGGFAARAAVERHPDVFDAALVFSGAGHGTVGYMLAKLDAEWTLKTLLAPDASFPLVNLPRPSDGAPDEDPIEALATMAKDTPEGRARLVLAAAFNQAPPWSLAGSPKPAADDLEAQADHLVASFGSSRRNRWQVEALAGGNVSWNHDVDYRAMLERSGLLPIVRAAYDRAGLDLGADLDRLARAPRIAADPAAVRIAERNMGYTGKVSGPILSLKTVGDPADPPSSDTAYTQVLRAAGTDRLLRNVYIDRPGHATMSVLERVVAFVTLMRRLETGRWDGNEAEMPTRMNALARELSPAGGGLGDARFVLFTPAPALRTWDFRNWGSYRAPATPATARSN
jgi:hypothetical protein